MFRRAINNLLSNALRYTPRTGNHRLNKKTGELFDLVIENPGNQSLKSIYQGCLTVFIGWIRPDNEKEKAAASVLRLWSQSWKHITEECMWNRIYARHVLFYPYPDWRKWFRIPNTENKDLNDKDVISLSCSKQKPFDIISATYQEGWIASSIPGVRVRREWISSHLPEK